MTTTTPVTTDRIRAMLTEHSITFSDYAEAQLAVPTLNAIYFWDTSNPKILQLRAQWRGIATNDIQVNALLKEIATCNSERSGPKAYLEPLENGEHYGLITECNILISGGLTPAQLNSFFETSMSMTMGFLNDLENTLPDFVTWNDTTTREDRHS